MSDLPLSARVNAPSVVDRPADSDHVTWRPATIADVDAIVECEREIGELDHPHYVTTREEVAEDFENSYVNAAADTMLALDPKGVVLGWGIAILSPGQETLVRSILAGGVRPSARGRGIGRELMAWQVGRGMQQLASSDKSLPGWLIAYAPARAESTVRLYARFGLEIARYFLELARDLSGPIADLASDPAVRIQPFSAEWSEATRVAKNDAFRDHWGSQPMTEEQWATFVAREVTREDLSSIALADGPNGEEVAALVLVSVSEEDWPGQGFSSAYIDLVGVTRAWRKRGLAAALLTNTLRAIAAAGLEKAVLDVDSESPTGALGLYTRLGFAESNRSMNFTRVF